MNWTTLPERSSRFWILLMIHITRLVGQRIARLLLYPISLYFVLINNHNREAACRYFSHVLDHAPTLTDHFRHYHTFASTLFDRMMILSRSEYYIKTRIIGLEHLDAIHASGKGCLLLGSHLGSFDILRMMGKTRAGLKVKTVMFGEATPQLVEIFQSINPDLHEDIVTIPGPAGIVGLAPEVKSGLMLGLLGDRVLPRERSLTLSFMGEPASFPTTAGYLSEVLEVPVLQFFCLHTGWGRYDIVFLPLISALGRPREGRDARVRQITSEFVANLETYAGKYPYNWFNFHDVWSTPSD